MTEKDLEIQELRRENEALRRDIEKLMSEENLYLRCWACKKNYDNPRCVSRLRPCSPIWRGMENLKRRPEDLRNKEVGVFDEG